MHFQFLTDSKQPLYLNSVCYFLLSWRFLEQCEQTFFVTNGYISLAKVKRDLGVLEAQRLEYFDSTGIDTIKFFAALLISPQVLSKYLRFAHVLK